MARLSRLLLLPLAALSALSAAQQLKIGDPAPPIQVAKWVKGTPVTKLGDGKVHVVEFWATWCGPCKVSIPHLTELANKYKGRATFTGVSVWEDQTKTDFMDKVESFVKGYGPKMEYNVAADGTANTMSETWMRAAGQNGIPAAFVVDQQGKIAWIGHPMGQLDKVVEEVIAGTFDVKAEAEKQAKAFAAAEKRRALMKPLNDALKAKDFPLALTEIDKLAASNPEMKPMLASTKFNVLLSSDEPAAYAYAKELGEGAFRDNPNMLNQIAWKIVDEKSKLKTPDYALAISLAQRASDLLKNANPMILDTLAVAQFKSGNVAKAIETQQLAVSLAEKDTLSLIHI